MENFLMAVAMLGVIMFRLVVGSAVAVAAFGLLTFLFN